MDRVLKYHFDKFRNRRALPPELERIGFKGSLFPNQEKLDFWRDWKRGLRVGIPDIGTVVRGAIDDLLTDEDGETLIPFDFKTRGSAPLEDSHTHYHHQMCIYGFMLERMGYKVARKAYLLFYHPREVSEDGSVLFNSDLVETKIETRDAEDLIRRAVETLTGSMPKMSDSCEFCGMRESGLKTIASFVR
jgi:hypothetical protein